MGKINGHNCSGCPVHLFFCELLDNWRTCSRYNIVDNRRLGAGQSLLRTRGGSIGEWSGKFVAVDKQFLSLFLCQRRRHHQQQVISFPSFLRQCEHTPGHELKLVRRRSMLSTQPTSQRRGWILCRSSSGSRRCASRRLPPCSRLHGLRNDDGAVGFWAGEEIQ